MQSKKYSPTLSSPVCLRFGLELLWFVGKIITIINLLILQLEVGRLVEKMTGTLVGSPLPPHTYSLTHPTRWSDNIPMVQDSVVIVFHMAALQHYLY